jgi:predicted adenylyl cyclase CyaB
MPPFHRRRVMGYNVRDNEHPEMPMYEAEVKILDINRSAVVQRLAQLGARKVFDDTIYALYYDTPEGLVRRQRGTFRLRREGPQARLTYKSPVEDPSAKVRRETEVAVSDFGAMHSILLSLGFTPWLEMEKHRTSYELEGVHFELDKYHGHYGYIPEFLEIEGRDAAVLHRYAALLGFEPKDCLPWDAVQLAEHYAGRKDRE